MVGLYPYLQTDQTIFFCISSVFNFSVITFNLKADSGIWFLRGKCGVEGYYGKIKTGYQDNQVITKK
jgi:hypothetical protein